jgi:tetratricopeptide (TPR) repeat protein
MSSLRVARAAIRLVIAAVVSGGDAVIAHDSLTARIAALSAQVAQSPSSPSLYIKRAELYRENRQWTEAIADLDRAERIDSTVGLANLVRAHVNSDRGQWQGAIDAASRFLERQPDHIDALVLRARAATKLGRPQAAAADFTRALSGRPSPDLYIERARVLAAIGPTSIEQAITGLDEGIARLGPIVTLELEAIDLETRLKRYDAALARVDAIVARSPRKESWLARRGAILELAGRRAEATAAYQSALDSLSSQSDRIQQTRASTALAADLRANLQRLNRSR